MTNTFTQLFAEYFGQAGIHWLFAAGIGAAVSLLLLGAVSFVTGIYDPLRRRIDSVSNLPRSTEGTNSLKNSLAKAIEPAHSYFVPKKGRDRSNVETMLRQAGYRSSGLLAKYYAAKFVLGIIFAAVTALLIYTFSIIYSSIPISFMQAILFILAGGFIGLILPEVFLSYQVKRRQQQITQGFPDVMDLLIVCVEAGLGLNAAIERVSTEAAISYPELAAELAQVNDEIGAGLDRITALQNFSERNQVDCISAFVSLVIQSLRFGTSIGDTLRIYAEEFRKKRLLYAEEQAMQIGTKMIFPLVLCIFPGFFIVSVGPAVLGAIKAFSQVY